MRFIDKDAFNAHTNPISAELKLLKVDEIFFLQVASFMFRFENNLLRPSFHNYFSVVSTNSIPGPPIRIIFYFLDLN